MAWKYVGEENYSSLFIWEGEATTYETTNMYGETLPPEQINHGEKHTLGTVTSWLEWMEKSLTSDFQFNPSDAFKLTCKSVGKNFLPNNTSTYGAQTITSRHLGRIATMLILKSFREWLEENPNYRWPKEEDGWNWWGNSVEDVRETVLNKEYSTYEHEYSEEEIKEILGSFLTYTL